MRSALTRGSRGRPQTSSNASSPPATWVAEASTSRWPLVGGPATWGRRRPDLPRLTGRADNERSVDVEQRGLAATPRRRRAARRRPRAAPLPDGPPAGVLVRHVLDLVTEPPGSPGRRPGGVALVVTNGADHLSRFRELRRRGIGADPGLIFDRFSLELAEPLLRRHFDDVAVHHRRANLAVPTVDPVLAYVDSARDVFEPGLPPGMTWDQVLATVESDVAAEIAEHGAFRCPVHSGTLVCR